jgi:hypothetical protein
VGSGIYVSGCGDPGRYAAETTNHDRVGVNIHASRASILDV